MPRYPRSWILEPGLAFHKVWRGHNREWNLQTPSEKQKYLQLLRDEHQRLAAINPLHALCLMSNHAHEVYSLADVERFSNFMRQHHSRYGAFFNRKHKRRGKVAQDRPHTSAIEDEHHEMIVTFYIHANPLRAGICKDAKDYAFSTHALYAFGKKAPWMKGMKITFPTWYMRLGATWKQRQAIYRKLFDAYLREYGLRKRDFPTWGIGSYHWCQARRETFRARWRAKQEAKSNAPPG